MTLLKALSVLLMVHVRRPDSPTGGASHWQIGISFLYDSKASGRINEVHLYGCHMGCGPRQTVKVGSLDMPASARVRWCYTRVNIETRPRV
jgi:hypothetical protein